jgi:hypothetical protein
LRRRRPRALPSSHGVVFILERNRRDDAALGRRKRSTNGSR